MYNFHLSKVTGLAETAVDTGALYGFWERRDGSEGGGLWFSREGDTIALVDFDGAYELPRRVIRDLRDLGITVSEVF